MSSLDIEQLALDSFAALVERLESPAGFVKIPFDSIAVSSFAAESWALRRSSATEDSFENSFFTF